MAAGTAVRIARSARKIFEREGPEAVSMRRIAAEVGITAMAIYRHFPDRAALLNAVADTGFEELRGRFRKSSGDVVTQLQWLMDEYLNFALKHPRLF